MRSTQKQQAEKNKRSTRRLFFAIKPDASATAALSEAQNKLTAAHKRPVVPENFHLTLAFIGNATAEYQQCLELAAANIQSKPFSIQLNQYGYFAKVKTFWIGMSEDHSDLTALHQQLNKALIPCGFRPAKKFVPHVTLLRKAEMVTPYEDAPTISCYTDRFFLVQSIPIEGGVRYHPHSEYTL